VAKKAGKKTSAKKTAGRGGETARKKTAAKKRVAKKKAAKKPVTRKKVVKAKSAKAASKKKARPSTRRVQRTGTAGKQRPVAAKRAGRKVDAAVAAKKESAVLPAGAVSGGPRPTKLKKADLEQFRALLLAKRAELIGDVTTLQDEALSKNRQDASGNLSSMPIHMADLGTDNYEQEFTLGLIEGERALLREIDEALARIEDRTYGICQATGKPIGKARLKARPWAKFCYEYMLAQEKGQQTEGF
jgi:RNA polymerase-binding protein DksA